MAAHKMPPQMLLPYFLENILILEKKILAPLSKNISKNLAK